MPMFKVLAGQHEEGGRIYRMNEVVNSTQQLDALFNPADPDMQKKFERVIDNPAYIAQPATGGQAVGEASRAGAGTQPATAPAGSALAGTLETMSLKQLQDMAAEEEIDLKGAKTKDEVLRVLRTQLR